jgi:sec-independent protein translocase protein TatC
MSRTPEQLDPTVSDAPPNGPASTRQAKRAVRKAARTIAKAAERRGEMTVIEHLEELRRRILLSILAIAIGGVVGWFLYEPVLRLLLDPYRRAVGNKDARLVFQGVVEPFLVKLKLSAYIGLALALPYVLFQLWRFITPGLQPKERRYAAPFVISSVLLFALGAYFAYLTFPTALRFLLGFGGKDLVPLLTAERYLNFIFLMFLAFGISFELPVVLQFLVIANILSSRQLRDFRRWAILLITVFAAVITPSQDPLSMLLMAIPMVIFYEGVIWISRLVFKR